MSRCEQGLADLKAEVDTLITIPNERLLEIVDKKTTLADAFATADEVLHQATKGISDLITVPGLINCDFADVRTVMREMGDALMGTGYGKGEDKAATAARQAISSPLLEDVSISGARGLLINVTGGEEMTLFDVNAATSLIYEEAGDEANIIFGAVIDPTMSDEMRVTVIATGFSCEPRELPAEPQRAVKTGKPGKTISLFPEDVMAAAGRPSRRIAPAEAIAASEPEIPAASNLVPEEESSKRPKVQTPSTGHRMPIFSEDDRAIPAYIRRLDEET
jgi:cell division protein FtsZ